MAEVAKYPSVEIGKKVCIVSELPRVVLSYVSRCRCRRRCDDDGRIDPTRLSEVLDDSVTFLSAQNSSLQLFESGWAVTSKNYVYSLYGNYHTYHTY